MRRTGFALAVVLGVVLLAGCGNSPFTPNAAAGPSDHPVITSAPLRVTTARPKPACHYADLASCLYLPTSALSDSVGPLTVTQYAQAYYQPAGDPDAALIYQHEVQTLNADGPPTIVRRTMHATDSTATADLVLLRYPNPSTALMAAGADGRWFGPDQNAALLSTIHVLGVQVFSTQKPDNLNGVHAVAVGFYDGVEFVLRFTSTGTLNQGVLTSWLQQIAGYLHAGS